MQMLQFLSPTSIPTASQSSTTVVLPFYILHPLSPPRVVWDAMIVLILLVNLVQVPYTVAFSQTVQCVDVVCEGRALPRSLWQVQETDPVFWMNLVFDVLFSIDICMSFFTGCAGA